MAIDAPSANPVASGGMTLEVHRRMTAVSEDLLSARWSGRIEAIVVSGSASRAEEIWRDGELISDIDVMVVTRSESLRLAEAIGSVLRSHACAGVSGGRITLRALRAYKTLAFYEAKLTGVVVAGRADVLDEVAMHGPGDLPCWEGLRLVANRLFEHVKLAQGLVDVGSCVRKSYEAIAEAQLVLEGRYRPSFAARAHELREHPPAGPVPNMAELYHEAIQARFGNGDGQGLPSAATALRDLTLQLDALLLDQTGLTGSADAQLARLSRARGSLGRRLLWTVHLARSGRVEPRAMLRDPAIELWRKGIAFLAGEGGDRLCGERLYQDWTAAPQPLVRRARRS